MWSVGHRVNVASVARNTMRRLALFCGTGVPFAAQPSIVRFDDFDVGSVYRMTIVLTNVSLTLNNLKMLPPPQSFLEYNFVPGKSLSSGLSTEVEVVFTPRLNEDFSGDLSFLATTGRFTVPIVCTTKKCVVSLSTRTLDFDEVCIGKTRCKTLVVRNTGSLATTFSVSGVRPQVPEGSATAVTTAATPPADGGEESFGFSLDVACTYTDVRIGAGATVSVPVRCTPTTVGATLAAELHVSFAADSVVHAMVVALRGRCVDVPVGIDVAAIDFATCRCGITYRRRITLRNHSDSPQSVIITPESSTDTATAASLSFHPSRSTIAAGQSLGVDVQFVPTLELLQRTQVPETEPGVWIVPGTS